MFVNLEIYKVVFILRHKLRLSAQEYRHIVRIVGNDIPGERKVLTGLTHIRGIGYNFASAILTKLQINPDSNIGYLTDANVTAIEGVLNDPAKAGFPIWFLPKRSFWKRYLVYFP